MSDKTKSYIDKKTGNTVQLTDYQFKLTSNRFTPVDGETATKKKGVDAVEDDEKELLAARLEYEEVTGQKAGNRKLETIRKEIEDFKANQ